MRIVKPIQTFCAVAALMYLAGCSGGGSSAIAPRPISPRAGGFSPIGQLNIKTHPSRHLTGYYSCPATGSIVYVSDAANDVINVYTGKLRGQAPCGQIGAGRLNVPYGLFVNAANHDLYVANMHDFDVLVFHRGQKKPYNSYTDPGGQLVLDVTVAKDGTVIASNVVQYGGPATGSISTWIVGPNGGTFVGNFPMTNDTRGGFITLQKNGALYYNDIDSTTNLGALWKMSCPAGACGAQRQVAGVSFQLPGGMALDDSGDLLVSDAQLGSAETFELPNPKPSSFPQFGSVISEGMAINDGENHWFVAGASNNVDAAEYSYPRGRIIGTVPGIQGGFAAGIALDP